MQKLKTQKGITLIALIITIIVMLILVGVTVTVAIDGGLFSKAKEAGEKYQAAAQQDAVLGVQYEYEIAKATGEFTGSYAEYVLEPYGLAIGDYVAYESGVEGYSDENGWQVLGAENGSVLLVSANPVDMLELGGAADYIDGAGINKLNAVCAPYGNGEGAIEARSLKVSDLGESIKPKEFNENYEENIKIESTGSADEISIYFPDDLDNPIQTNSNFKMLEDQYGWMAVGQWEDIKDTYYQSGDLSADIPSFLWDLSNNGYDMWLADTYEGVFYNEGDNTGGARWGMRILTCGYIDGIDFADSIEGSKAKNTYNVFAVVVLEPDAEILK